MSGFSPAWLTLREPADLAARNREVLHACARAFSGRETLTICDLGAGTGASVRALADLLPPRQQWTLVDHDPDNLAAATAALETWADEASSQNGVLHLRHGARHLDIRTRLHDLAQEPLCWPADVDLVTASAILDLTSTAWIERLVAALAARKIPLLSTLTADGLIAPEPAHALDKAVVAGFHAHQTNDKGFGPSAGITAARILEEALENAGYTLTKGESPWVLSRSQSSLLHATLSDIAGAVAETGAVERTALTTWLDATRAKTERLVIGHRDLFAVMGAAF